jgi:serine/threonine-protein kinase
MDPLLETARARLGRVLRGKWKLEEVLGVGGMATVYRAQHRNGAAVAIKMLHPELTLDRSLCERFLREGYVANRVNHEGAVKILDDDTDEIDGSAFLVMELLEGETVEHRWKRKGERLPASEVLSIAYHAADVLVAAHEQGIVHRDVKPENLFLTRGAALKILDFGVARLRERQQGDVNATQQGAALGTPAFMPPEQARGRWNLVDGRSDVWSLGATMFTLLSGQWVHERDTTAEQIIATATEPAPTLAKVAPHVPLAVVSLVDRALRYDMSERYSDMAAMRWALQEVSSGPLSERRPLPQASVFAGFAISTGAIERKGASSDERNLDQIHTAPAVTAVGAQDAAPGVQGLELPALDSNPLAAAAPPAPAEARPVRAESSSRPRRGGTSRAAMALGISIALLGFVVAFMIVALRTNYFPTAREALAPAFTP